ncbi:MAG: hypothetical protein QM718_00135 [Steroidobacteraceae bacterium]
MAPGAQLTGGPDHRRPLKLATCDIRQCEGRCCYDGVYLWPGEEAFLRELVARVPELAAKLPAEFIVDGHWNGAFLGRKTATRPQAYATADFPAHFTRTRCVFSDAQGFCELEKFARGRGQHPWTFKPATCWMFPLEDQDGKPVQPVRGPEDDPYRTPDYPGYASCVPCGRHAAAGQPWRKALAREIAYLRKAAQLPLLGSPGHTVEELLAAGNSGGTE